MAWYETHFGGLPVAHLPALPNASNNRRIPRDSGPLPAAGKAAWALRVVGYEPSESFTDHFARFLATVDTVRVSAVVVGCWGEYESSASEPIRLLAEAADRLPALRHLYFGDISPEESELAWIQQADVTPLLTAFPRLETLIVRGGDDLAVAPVRHTALRRLEVETAGLPGSFVRRLGECTFPALEELELWLGVADQGGDTTVADLAGILGARGLPALRRLGLMNSDIQDEVATAVAGSAVLAQLRELNLSMGTLGDEGVEALLSGQPLGHLDALVIQHHFMRTPMQDRLRAALPGVRLELEAAEDVDAWDEDEWRYVAVSE